MFERKPDGQAENDTVMVKLKNGSEVPKSMVLPTKKLLELLLQQNFIACYELVEKCKNPKHEMFGNAQEVVAKLKLINSDGTIRPETQNIILSALEYDDLNIRMRINDPVAPQPTVTNRM